MSDEQEFNIDDVGGGADEPESGGGGKKTGFLPGIVITILKWAAIAIGFIILGVTTTLITFKLSKKGPSTTSVVMGPEAYPTIPDPYEVYDGLGDIRGNTSGENPAIFSCKVLLGYKEGAKEVTEELIKRKSQIRNLIMKYLSAREYEELQPKYYVIIEEELKMRINTTLLKKGKLEAVILDDFTAIR